MMISLLKKYMRLVAVAEGITFVKYLDRYSDRIEFTEEEAQELRKVDETLWEDDK